MTLLLRTVKTDLEAPEFQETEDGLELTLSETSEAVVLTVASATGGCGKTFFSTNLAALTGRTGKRVLLVDLDLQFGEVAAALQLRSQYSIYDGLYGAKGAPLPEDALAEHLDELIVRHDLGFDVLTAPRDPSLADHVGARDVERVIEAVIPRYDVVVIDTPPSLNEVVLTALDHSDLVVVMATLDVPSLKNLRVFLDTVTRLKIDDSRLRLVLNKVDSDVGLDVKQVQETFNDRFVGLISQSRAIMRAMNMGTVVIESEPRHAVSRELLKAVGDVLPEDLAAQVRAATPGGERGGLLSRLLSKKGDQG